MKKSIVNEISSSKAFNFKSIIALKVIVGEMKNGDKESLMPIFMKILRAELSQYDMTAITSEQADSLTRQIFATLGLNGFFADPEFIAIEQEILDRREVQSQYGV